MSTYLKVIAVGNVGQDPETKRFEGGGQLTTLSLATTETWKDKQTGEKKSITEWSRVTFNGKLSEIVDEYVKKGDKILVDGKLRTRKWSDKNGIERYSTEIIAREMTMMGSNSSNKNQGSAVESYQQQQAPSKQEDDLPF